MKQNQSEYKTIFYFFIVFAFFLLLFKAIPIINLWLWRLSQQIYLNLTIPIGSNFWSFISHFLAFEIPALISLLVIGYGWWQCQQKKQTIISFWTNLIINLTVLLVSFLLLESTFNNGDSLSFRIVWFQRVLPLVLSAGITSLIFVR